MVTGLLCSRRKRDTPVMVPVVPILGDKVGDTPRGLLPDFRAGGGVGA